MRINIYKSVVCLIVALLTLSFTAYGGERSSAHAAAVSQEANRATPGKSPDFTLSDAQLEVIGYCIMNLFEYPVCSEPGKELLTDKSVTMLAHWIINDNFIAEFRDIAEECGKDILPPLRLSCHELRDSASDVGEGFDVLIGDGKYKQQTAIYEMKHLNRLLKDLTGKEVPLGKTKFQPRGVRFSPEYAELYSFSRASGVIGMAWNMEITYFDTEYFHAVYTDDTMGDTFCEYRCKYVRNPNSPSGITITSVVALKTDGCKVSAKNKKRLRHSMFYTPVSMQSG